MLFGGCMIVVILSTLPYTDYPNFDEDTCHLINVSSPTQLPSYNNTEGWKECDCGKRCIAWSPCISLYASANPNFIIRNELYVPNRHPSCTFYNNNCPHGEDARNTVLKMEEAQTIMQEYLNQNITCYVNGDASQIYLHKSYMLALTITFAVFALLLMCCGGYYCWITYLGKKIIYSSSYV